ncbi:hypothetical protein GCM10023195_58400 [Actinoallomurus liliacearum]|uniref:Uncharacterized protein n=1 Tax=Actinoallomurus liliacearum TaxID=1080073 RepID=A0ABP8TRU3_9ACTN
MNMSDLHGVLAVGTGTGEDGANSFLGSDIGKAVIALCGVAGIIILVVCIFKMVKNVTNGRPGEGFKVFFWGLVVGGLLFRLDITVSAVSYMSGLLQKVFDSAQKVTG